MPGVLFRATRSCCIERSAYEPCSRTRNAGHRLIGVAPDGGRATVLSTDRVSVLGKWGRMPGDRGRRNEPECFSGKAGAVQSVASEASRSMRPARRSSNAAHYESAGGHQRTGDAVPPAGGPLQIGVQISTTRCGFTGAGRAPRQQNPDPVRFFAVRTMADTPPALRGTPAITFPPASLPVGAPQVLSGFNVKFTEGFTGAFRRRNVGTSSDAPLFMTVQAEPGLAYNTESGFLNTLFPNAMHMDSAGLADTGTRLFVRFQNVPKDVLIWVTTRDVRSGTTQYSELSARAILTTTDANGLGPLTPVRPSITGLAQIPVVNGTATAVWEVVSANPATLQDISFGVAVSAQTATPGQGTVLATAGLAPFAATDSANDAVPLFKNTSTPVPAFAVSNLLTVPALNCVSGASYQGPNAAPGSIVAAFGRNLAAASAFADEGPLPSTLSGTSVELIDTTGAKKNAALLFVSPSQINFVTANDLELGPVLVNVLSGARLVASGYVQLNSLAPSIFSANGDGSGVFAGEALINSGRSLSLYPSRYISRIR